MNSSIVAILFCCLSHGIGRVPHTGVIPNCWTTDSNDNTHTHTHAHTSLVKCFCPCVHCATTVTMVTTIQLLSLQYEQHQAMEDYYKHRGLTGRRFLTVLRQQSVANSNQIKKLTEKFEVTIREMHEFLESSSFSAAAAQKKMKSSGRKVHFNNQLVVSSSD